MNYELAKELKDAGFPQPAPIGKHPPDHHSPDLSELIEACGDGLQTLEKNPNGWGAFGINSIDVFGSTPEEAVAKLWLALNPPEA